MNRDNGNDSMPSQPVSLFRGLYGRVARKLGVDPSYVSRVARGERKSKVVLSALNEEVRNVLAELRRAKPATSRAADKRSKSPE
jgi:hypothetical protein